MKSDSIDTYRSYLTALIWFNNFLVKLKHNVETVLTPLSKGEMDVYEILDSFVISMVRGRANNGIGKSSIKLYLAAAKSYLGYHDIDIIPARFKKRVTIPQVYKEDEQAIDVSDIRKILVACNNRRLKTYLLILASGGMRAVEALSIRIEDIDFSVNPTKIHLRSEWTKTRKARDIYISDEATQALKAWLTWKYDRTRARRGKSFKSKKDSDLVFSTRATIDSSPKSLYRNMNHEFLNNLESAGAEFLDKKDNDSRRHKITLHSFRRFVETTISDAAGKDYAEWFLGHVKSPYYTNKEQARREIYRTKCMKYLTFLDYSLLEAAGHSTEASLQEKTKEIQALQEQMVKMSGLVEKLKSAVELYKPVFVSEMQRLNPHLDPSGFEISPFDEDDE